MFWVPQSGDIGMGVSILSYNGGVQFGVITDTRCAPSPRSIIDEFAPEFAKLSHGDVDAALGGCLTAPGPPPPAELAGAGFSLFLR